MEDDIVRDAVVGESGHAAFLEGIQEVAAEGLALVWGVEEGEVEGHLGADVGVGIVELLILCCCCMVEDEDVVAIEDDEDGNERLLYSFCMVC